jgi:hypothetical protein
MKLKLIILCTCVSFFHFTTLCGQTTDRSKKENTSTTSSSVVDKTSYFGTSSCWSYKARGYYGGMGPFINSSSNSMAGDTIIHSIEYKKLDGDQIIAIRQENKKIYVILKNGSNEVLLYDFGLIKGDIFHSNATTGLISGTPIVSNVDSIQMYDGNFRKRITIGSDIWIEGIGSVMGFDFPLRNLLTCDCNSTYELISFAKEEVLSFYNPVLCASFNCCYSKYTVEKQIIKEDGNKFDVFPNPARDIITVKSTAENKKCKLELFDLKGVLVNIYQIDSSEKNIHLNQFQKGLYFYKISTDGSILQTGRISKE